MNTLGSQILYSLWWTGANRNSSAYVLVVYNKFAGLFLFCFVPAFLPICYRSFRQYDGMFRLTFYCVPWPLAILLPLLVVSVSLFPFLYFSFCFVCCCIFAVCVLFLPSRHVFVFRLARSSSFTCLHTGVWKTRIANSE